MKKSIMITTASHPAAAAAALAIHTLPQEFEASADKIKEEAKRQLDELNASYKERHRAAWNDLEQAMGLDPETNHSLCAEHLEEHGVAFLSEAEDEPMQMGGPGGLNIGEMIAKALGGKMVAGDGDSGVVEVPLN
jgi:hypothetical protein